VSVTRKDVARLAGVSTATVSYVINNGPKPVAEETRKRVLRAISQLDYRPNAIARSLVTKRTNTIGFILPDILNPVHAAIAKEFEDALWASGFNLILGNSDEEPEREHAYLRSLFSKGVDGVALTPTGQNRQLLHSIANPDRSFVLLDRRLEGLDVDCVLFDNVAGTYQAVRHLTELGHKRIGLINLTKNLTPGNERLQGYERALLEAGIPLDPALVREGDFKARAVGTRVNEGEILLESLLALNPPPTAVFISNNRLLTGVLRVVSRLRLRVPEDIAIATFDDLPHYAERRPTITAVGTSVEEFGSTAARLLIERVNRLYTGPARVIRVPALLHIRESTAGKEAANAPEIATA
jgi:LacI family transcriptional regulator